MRNFCIGCKGPPGLANFLTGVDAEVHLMVLSVQWKVDRCAQGLRDPLDDCD